jgi:hypothetical protein
MSSKLTFIVQYEGEPYGVIELDNGSVWARIGGNELRGVMLAHALQWVREHNPFPGNEPNVKLVRNY